MVGIPLMKLGFLALRQVTKPIAKKVVVRAKEGHNRRLCIFLGRVSLGLSGAIMELAQQEEVKDAQERGKKQKELEQEHNAAAQKKSTSEGSSISSSTSSEMENIKNPTPSSPPPLSGFVKKVEAVSPRSRSLLESISYGPLPQKNYNSSVILNPNGRTGEAVKIFILYPYKTTWELFRNRFLAPYPEDKLVDAGADLLIELMAFTILALILSYELNLQFKSNARKEALLLARIEFLEKRVTRLEKAHHLAPIVYHEDNYPEHLREDVVRFHWVRQLYKVLKNLLMQLAKNATHHMDVDYEDGVE